MELLILLVAGVVLLLSAGATKTAPPPADESKALPKGLRIHNPMNVTPSPDGTWEGQIGVDGILAVFATDPEGLRAGMLNALTQFVQEPGLSLKAFGDIWAPPGLNNASPGDYGRALATMMRVPDTSTIDPTNDAQLVSLGMAVITQEQGEQPFDVATLLAAARAAIDYRNTHPLVG